MRSIALVVLPLFAPNLAAQAPTDPVELQRRLDDKLAQPFLKNGGVWHTDLEAAKRAAARDGKLILAHCTRSFVPCGTSIRCERSVLSTAEFAEVAEQIVLYCHVTAHVDDEHDATLFRLGGSGWPHHAVLDASGRVLGRHPSWKDKSPAALGKLVDDARAFLQVERETEATIQAAHRRRLETGLEAGALSLDEALNLFAHCGPLSGSDAQRIAAHITDLEVLQVLAGHDRFDETSHAKVGEHFYGMWRMGKRPSTRNTTRDFWGGILIYLENRENPNLEVYEEGLAALEAQFGESRGYRRFLEARRAALVKLRAAAESNKRA